ncbi:uncharacterized protein LOC114120050 isoform X1 [Aphis gossypii]|uniref:Kinetochore protein Nuf2 N-terminal domain-containing protein n=1 Tax=Aphis gossypii TaxID=80765 RepID=A0A9P0JBX1_APHGO|nr:uncharacterized protein LOC114120050 isoform X1 [Aphis gossypii]CAH1736377.1 unnamed protein product [Aphis gossypii]
MTWQPNVTTMNKQNKSSMYVEYGNLIKELEQYMPQFKATIKDLQEPSQSFVTDFYTDVFSEFFCDVNNLTEIHINQNLTYNEMYSETVPILNMCTALKYIYSKLGIDDFGLNDICDPSSKRTYRLLQTMINFIKYSDEKIHEVDAKMKAVRNMKDTIDRYKKQKDIIVNTINKKSLDRIQRGVELKTIAEEVKDGKSELAKIQKHRDDVLKELDKVKQDQDDIEKKCSKLCELKDNIIRDINDLRAQIVEAPDLLKADHERLKRMKNEITEKKTAMMAQVSAKKQTVIILEQELTAQEKRLRLLTDVTEKNERISKLLNEIESMLQKKCELEESSENLKEKIEIMERERADINNKINYFTKEMEREHNSYKSKYDALNKEIDSMIKQSSHQSETIKSLDFEINKCNLRKKELETDVITIMEDFEFAKNALNELQKNFNLETIKNLMHHVQNEHNDY